MAINQSRRLRPDDLDSDREAVVAVQSISNYQPINQTYSAQALVDLGAARDQAQQAEIRAQHALAAARDAAVAAEWALHNAVLGARTQVLAQFGDDSDAAEMLSSENDSPQMMLERKADRAMVNAALSRLAPPFREVLILREMEDMPYEMIATVVGVPIGTVMSRLSRARRQFRAEVEGRLGKEQS